jgi:hypothetical protein
VALKAIINSLDSVEERFRSLYEEKDGKFVLMVDGIKLSPAPRRSMPRSQPMHMLFLASTEPRCRRS